MALRFKEITMTQQFELEEILALAVKAEPKYSVVFPYFNDNDFYNRLLTVLGRYISSIGTEPVEFLCNVPLFSISK